MTREEAIDILVGVIAANSEEENEALDMADEALEGVCFDEWCDDCKEYDTEKKCCPRFNRVIRGAVADALDAIPSTDRPMVIKCKPFLSEEDFKAFAEQVSDQNVILISDEAEAVSTNTSTNTSTKSTNISTDTSADRPRGEWNDIGGVIRWGCSLCHYAYDQKFNFCPNCGADMRGDTE